MDTTVLIDAKLSKIETLSWENVTYALPPDKGGKEKVLLNGISGQVRAGQVVAILGGSGAGKTTLLNTLAGRIGPGRLEGNILVDGYERNAALWNIQCAYVEQDDIMFRNLSVFETLKYAAYLRLPSSMSNAMKLQRVESIINALGLQGCRNTWIGDSLSRGISGGERKRVSIAIELVTDPQIIFLDEPTSGLDSFNALNVVSMLKTFAQAQNKIVLMTIHQPRTDIVNLLDNIIVLSMGKCIWFGQNGPALKHFASLGFPLPEQTNASDFYLDISTYDGRTEESQQVSIARVDKFANAFQYSETLPAKKDSLQSRVTQWPSTWLKELNVLTQRSMVDVLRDKPTMFANFGQTLILTLLIGFIYFKLELDKAGVQSRIGVLFFITINQTFGIVMPQIAVFPLQREIIKRERSSGSYRSLSAYLAKVLSSLPVTMLASVIFSSCVYHMIGLQNIGTKFATFICIVAVQTFTSNALGLFIGAAVPSVQVGQIVGPLSLILLLIFGGLFVNLAKVPEVFRWIQWVSYIAYTNKALNQNEFDAEFKYCATTPINGVCPQFISGIDIIKETALDTPGLWICVIINLAIAVGYLLLGALAFSRTTRPLLRLK